MTSDDRDDVMQALEHELGRIEPSAGFQAGVRRRIDTNRPDRQSHALWWAGGIAAAALVALVVVPFVAGHRSAPDTIAKSATRVPDAVAPAGSRSIAPEAEAASAERLTARQVVHGADSEAGRRMTRPSTRPREAATATITPHPLVPSDRAVAVARLIAFVRAGKSLGDVSNPAPDEDVKPLDPIPVIDIAPIKVSTLEATVAASSRGEMQ